MTEDSHDDLTLGFVHEGQGDVIPAVLPALGFLGHSRSGWL